MEKKITKCPKTRRFSQFPKRVYVEPKRKRSKSSLICQKKEEKRRKLYTLKCPKMSLECPSHNKCHKTSLFRALSKLIRALGAFTESIIRAHHYVHDGLCCLYISRLFRNLSSFKALTKVGLASIICLSWGLS
jgi:hypothetical protein